MKHYGLLGKKLSHSKSPLLHKIIYQQINLEADYTLIELEDLSNLSKRVEIFDGFNVTIPYKEEITKEILIENRSNLAAVNTISKNKDHYIGYNTDVDGFLQLLIRNQVSHSSQVTILGYGGAALAVIEALQEYGLKDIVVYSRRKHQSYENSVRFESYTHFDMTRSGIVINTTPLGMYPDQTLVVSTEWLQSFSCFIDLIYNPLITPFLQVAIDKKAQAINGIEMLVFQAIKAIEIWESITISESDENRILKEFINECT